MNPYSGAAPCLVLRGAVGRGGCGAAPHDGGCR